MKGNSTNERELQSALPPPPANTGTSHFPVPADEGEQIEINFFRFLSVRMRRVNGTVILAVLLILVVILVFIWVMFKL